MTRRERNKLAVRRHDSDLVDTLWVTLVVVLLGTVVAAPLSMGATVQAVLGAMGL